MVALAAGSILAGLIVLGIPTITEPTISFGHYRVSTIPTGISLFQPGGNHRYMLVSAATDQLASWKQPAQPLVTQKFTALTGHVQAYLTNQLLPVSVKGFAGMIRFDTNQQFNNATKQQNNALTITRTGVSNVPMSLTYGRDDILFDSQGMLYSENADTVREHLSALFNRIILPDDATQRTAILPTDTTLYIVNPHLPGVIALQPVDGQTLTVEKDAKTVRLSGATREQRMTMTLVTYADLSEVRL